MLNSTTSRISSGDNLFGMEREVSGIEGLAAASSSAVPTGKMTPLPTGRMDGHSTTTTLESPYGDTLDETVTETFMRDFRNIGRKLKQVLLPKQDQSSTVLNDWDLWGPLVFCLALSARLSVTSSADSAPAMFTSIFVLVWGGAGVVTLNSQLLGGKMSFFQSVCVLGYCIFPIVCSSVITCFTNSILVRCLTVGAAFAWSVYSALGFLSEANLAKRRLLAVYPICLFYFVLCWIVLLSRPI